MKRIKELINALSKKGIELKSLEAKKTEIAGKICVDLLQQNFTSHHGFLDTSVEIWKKRGVRTNKIYDSGYKNKKGYRYKSDRPLLLQSQDLFKSLKFTKSNSRVKIGFDKSQANYAKTINEGGGYWMGMQIPQRKIIGYTKLMRRRIIYAFNRETRAILKKFAK